MNNNVNYINTKFGDFRINNPVIKMEADESRLYNRHPCYAVPIPAQTSWSVQSVKQTYVHVQPTLDDNEYVDSQPSTPIKRKKMTGAPESPTKTRRSKYSNSLLNHPLADGDFCSAIIYFYDVNEIPFKLNEGCEVIGILSYTQDFNTEGGEEVFNPPHAKVGRIHVIGCRLLNSSYPLYMPYEFSTPNEYCILNIFI